MLVLELHSDIYMNYHRYHVFLVTETIGIMNCTQIISLRKLF